MWAEFKRLHIQAERQAMETVADRTYWLMADYCLPKIQDAINQLGGVEEDGRLLPRRLDLDAPDSAYQLGLFDE
ncbi:MAG TPA: hypothetical protein VNK95_07275 [Caldilineaceae bacterium]|nr:hypothetical protein [Caldilineaceae bacterium]